MDVRRRLSAVLLALGLAGPAMAAVNCIPVDQGGSGACSFSVTNGIVTFDGSKLVAVAGPGTTTTVLHGNAIGPPSYGAVSLTADVTGTLPSGSGGSGVANPAAHTVQIAEGSSPFAGVALAADAPLLGTSSADPHSSTAFTMGDSAALLTQSGANPEHDFLDTNSHIMAVKRITASEKGSITNQVLKPALAMRTINPGVAASVSYARFPSSGTGGVYGGGATAISYSVWWRLLTPPPLSTVTYIFRIGIGSDPAGLSLGLQTDNTPGHNPALLGGLSVGGGGAGCNTAQLATLAAVGVKHHVTLRWDNTTGNGDVFLDGSSACSIGTFHSTFGGVNDIGFGADQDGTGNGSLVIDEFQWYINYKFSTGDIATLYNSGNGSDAAISGQTPYIWYHFDDAAGSSTVADSGSAGKNLTLKGTTLPLLAQRGLVATAAYQTVQVVQHQSGSTALAEPDHLDIGDSTIGGTTGLAGDVIDLTKGPLTRGCANDTTTGTEANRLVKLSAGKCITATTSDTTGLLGVAVGFGAGVSGSAQIAIAGPTPCLFDGSTTRGDYVVAGTTTSYGGYCHDAGSTIPAGGSGQILGRVWTTNSGIGLYTFDQWPGEPNGPYSAGTGISLSGGAFANTGVTSAVAGTGIGVSGATGAVTISNTGVTSIAAGSNITVSGATGAVTINSTGGGGSGAIGATAFSQTSSSTPVANTVTETTILGTGSGSTSLGTNFFGAAGNKLDILAAGSMGDTGTPTLQLKLYLGATAVLDTGAITLASITGTQNWTFYGSIVDRTTGATGTVISSGTFCYQTNTGIDRTCVQTVPTSTTTIDTTANLAFDMKATWGTANASNTITSTQTYLVPGAPAMTQSLIGVRVFGAGTSTYTPTSGTTQVVVIGVGGGGASGSCQTTSGSQISIGAAGGAGGTFIKYLVSGFSGVSYTVGAGGAAAAAGNHAGGNGTDTTFAASGGTLTGSGGTGGGSLLQVPPSWIVGGVGGAATNGDQNIHGANGGATYLNGIVTGCGGFGGSTYFGTGGPEVCMFSSTNNGAAGTSYGSGASASLSAASLTQHVGSAGADGVIVIYEYGVATVAGPTNGVGLFSATPASGVPGSLWFPTDLNAVLRDSGSSWDVVQGRLWQNSAQGVVNNTTTEKGWFTNSTGVAGIGSTTIPANYFKAGQLLHIHASGIFSTTGTPTLNIRLALDCTTACSNAGGGNGGVATNNNAVSAGWQYDAWCSTTAGGTTSIFCTTLGTQDGTHSYYSANMTFTSVDTTVAHTLQPTILWGTANASNTITMYNGYMER